LAQACRFMIEAKNLSMLYDIYTDTITSLLIHTSPLVSTLLVMIA
jgi:hypothetical protein